MKAFWKRTNRGLWLGLVLLVVLLTVIIVGQVRFGREKPKIRQLAKNYITDLLEVNAAVGDAVGGQPMTDAQKQTQSDALEAVIRQYWYEGKIDRSSGYFTSYNAVQLREKLSQWQADAPVILTDLRMQIDSRSVSVKADGPGRAIVIVYAGDITATLQGKEPVDGALTLFPINLDGKFGSSVGEWRVSGSAIFGLELARRNGKWRVVGMSSSVGYGYGGLDE